MAPQTPLWDHKCWGQRGHQWEGSPTALILPPKTDFSVSSLKPQATDQDSKLLFSGELAKISLYSSKQGTINRERKHGKNTKYRIPDSTNCLLTARYSKVPNIQCPSFPRCIWKTHP
jgi:hypothetical protein